MCRIYGFNTSSKTPDDEMLLQIKNVSKSQLAGGPDAQGFYVYNGVGIGINRLSIQDVIGGNQPYKSQKSNIICVFNGEIYNHQEIRKNQLREIKFDDNCDGSVIVPLYEKYGDDFVSYLDGMYAIAIIDNQDSTQVKIFTDQSGMKSIFYTLNDNGLFFSSELNGLLEFKDVKKNLSYRYVGIDDFLVGRAVWGPETIYKDIFTLEPGEKLVYTKEKLKLSKFTFPINSTATLTSRDAVRKLNELMEDEVGKMLSADVPVCVITSGGLDSSYITAIASRLVPNIHSFHITYEGNWPSDERKYARAVSEHCKTTHHEIVLNPDEFPELIYEMVNSLDQPNTAPHALSTYALFKEVKRNGFKVSVTGDGADEIFAGYKRFIDASNNQSESWLAEYTSKLGVADYELIKSCYGDNLNEMLEFDRTCSVAKKISSNLDTIETHTFSEKLESLMSFDRYHRFPYYILRRLDHLSMACSVEARIPFLQKSILNFASMLKTNFKSDGISSKWILSNAAKGYLPNSIIDRKKQPFTLPIESMLSQNTVLYDFAKFEILNGSLASEGYFNIETLKYIIDKQLISPNRQYANIIWSVMICEIWFKLKGKR